VLPHCGSLPWPQDRRRKSGRDSKQSRRHRSLSGAGRRRRRSGAGMSERQPVLSIEAIEAYYGEVQALRGISLDVYEGQIVALLGGNGAGKSTTLRTISGLVRGVGGRILLQGKVITNQPPHHISREGVVHVPEGRRILKGMSIQENLE